MTGRRAAALVTGAADGIGAAIAVAMSRYYRVVVVNYRTRQSDAARVVNHIAEAGARGVLAVGDVSNMEGVRGVFAAIDSCGEPLELLVNNAGSTGGFAGVDMVEAEQLDRAYCDCLRSTVMCTREAVNRMIPSHRGSIINISSTAARTTGAGEWVHYAAIKAAVNTFTRGAALELADKGIRVNAVAPGLVDSPLHERNGDEDRPTRLRSVVPMGRIGIPTEVADAVAFLASPEASYITGHILEVSGGR